MAPLAPKELWIMWWWAPTTSAPREAAEHCRVGDKDSELHYTPIRVQQKLKSGILGWRHSSCLVSLAIRSTLVFCFWQEHSGLSVCSGPGPADSSHPQPPAWALLCTSVKQISPWKTCIWIWGLGYRQKTAFSPKFRPLGGTGTNF